MNRPDDQPRVLIAEDTVVGRQVLTRILTEAGCKVSAVANGQGVLNMLAGSEFHLVIMDCMMPEMDGFSASRAIRSGQAGKANSKLPIIAISGLASEADRQSCLEAGMNELVQKPITSESLLPVVSAVLERRQDETVFGGSASLQEDEQSLLQSLDDWSPGFMDNIIDQFLEDVPNDIAALKQAMDC
ncbi:MAG: response regulator, partial [Gammaproteobacteria bacterium]|nr:response regulator [Gammaproteobacteria bacterium]